MKPTLKMMLVTRRPKQTGKYPVKLQITFQRKTKQYLVGIDLSTDEFEYVLNPSKNKDLFDAKTKRNLSVSAGT